MRREASAAHIVRSFKKKLLRYHHQICVHIYGVNSLAGIDFQQFLKNKMAATAIFVLI